MTYPQDPAAPATGGQPRKSGVPTWAIVLLSVAGGLVLLCGAGAVVAVVVADEPATTAQPDTDAAAETGAPTSDPTDDPTEEPDPEPADDPDDDSANKPVVPLGADATVREANDVLGTITVTEAEVSTTPAFDFGDGPDNGHFLVFTVEMEAESSLDVWSDDFYIVHPDGERVDNLNGNAYDAIDLDDELGYAQLDSGQHRSGLLAFDLATLEGELAYAPNLNSGPVVAWQFDEG